MSTFEDIKRKRDDHNQSVYSALTTESNLQKQGTNRSFNQSINDDEEQEELQDSFVEKMKTIRATGRDVVNKTGHFNYDEEKHEIAKSALLDARKPQFVM